jgi:mannose-6-phosphate isomerase-like protein (cupin superfamily)
METTYELKKILSKLQNKDDYFVEFLDTRSLEAGVIRLRRDQKDTQTTHRIDELYYVIEGQGFILIDGKNYALHKGTIVYVPADTLHNFYGNEGDLIVLYFFPKA